ALAQQRVGTAPGDISSADSHWRPLLMCRLGAPSTSSRAKIRASTSAPLRRAHRCSPVAERRLLSFLALILELRMCALRTTGPHSHFQFQGLFLLLVATAVLPAISSSARAFSNLISA